ncbi:hypothetical protein [Acinetobacter bereziniae]|nr:hypothetical protein [Acinetobacter bereziniae]
MLLWDKIMLYLHDSSHRVLKTFSCLQTAKTYSSLKATNTLE